MIPERLTRNVLPPIWKFLGVTLASTVCGAGFVRYAQLVDGGSPILEIASIFGLWSLSAVIIGVAALPTVRGYSVSYSYAISFGLLFGAVSVIGIAYTGQPPSQLEKFGYGLVIGLGSALTLGTLAVVLGVLYRQTVALLSGHTDQSTRIN